MKRVLALAAAAAVLVPAVAAGSDGDVDAGFGTNGRVTLDLGGDDVGRAAVVQADGRLIVAGSRTAGTEGDFAIARFNQDGTPDTGFSGDGQAFVDFGDADVATGVAVMTDGRIVVGGYTDGGADASDFAVAVLRPDGQPDGSFSTDGKATVDIADDDRAAAVAVDGSNRVVLGGSSETGGTASFALARLTAAGVLDDDFGTGGKKTVTFAAGPARIAGIALTPTGGVVAVGRTTGGPAPDNMAVARLDASGVEDPTFSGDGRLVYDFGADDSAEAVAVRANGSLVIAGSTDDGDPDFAVLGLEADGDPDPTFSGDGELTLSFGAIPGGADSASAVTLTSTGKIAIAGRSDLAGTHTVFAVALLEASGAPSTGFSGNGKRTVDFAGGDDDAFAVAARGNRIYAAGTSGPAAGTRNFAAAALEGGGPRVAVRDASVSETAGSVAVRLDLTAPSTVPVSVRLTTASGTARSERDFTPVDTVVTFPPGVVATTVPIEILDDKTIEALESFKLLISAPSEAGIQKASSNVRISSDEVDRTKPSVSSLKVSPKTFKASRGATVRWRLSEPASVLLSFERKRAFGTKRTYEPLVGRRVLCRAGTNSLKVGKRIVGRRLLPGLYRVKLRATDFAGNDSRRATASFRVKG